MTETEAKRELQSLIDEEMQSIESADSEGGGIEDVRQLTVYLTSLAHAAFALGRQKITGEHEWQFYANGSFCRRCGASIGSGSPCR